MRNTIENKFVVGLDTFEYVHDKYLNFFADIIKGVLAQDIKCSKKLAYYSKLFPGYTSETEII